MVSPFIKDPSKILSEKDAQELEKTLTEIKQKYPAEAAAFSQYIDGINARMEEGKKQKEAGDVAASKKSYYRSESEARKLLAQVSERDRAEEAFRGLQETKQKIGASAQPDRPNLLRWIALEKEKDASDAFGKNDFSGARILCSILIKVHELSLRVEDVDQALASLAELSTFIRREAEAALAPAKQAWL